MKLADTPDLGSGVARRVGSSPILGNKEDWLFMKHSFEVGFSFGLTSAVITTLGLMVGLSSGTHSQLAVIGGILTIALADSFSDALGIHISEESENVHTHKEVWLSTFFTFISKFIFTLIFAVPFLFFSLNTSIAVDIVWGLILLGVFSYFLAKKQKIKPWKVIAEHVFIAILVIFLAHYLGEWIHSVCS